MSPISALSGNYLQSVLSTVLQTSGLTGKNSSANLSSSSVSSIGLPSDSPQLSPFAQVLNQLQQLQQSDPAKYQQVTGQIAANLQAASQTAETNGNSAASAQLSQLATDFKNASQNGQLPNVQDLSQALAGHHHHHHHAQPASSSDSSSTGDSSSGSSVSQELQQLLAAFRSVSSGSGATGTGNSALDPMSIIENTLTSAGVGASAS
jgi:hypothetical protein